MSAGGDELSLVYGLAHVLESDETHDLCEGMIIKLLFDNCYYSIDWINGIYYNNQLLRLYDGVILIYCIKNRTTNEFYLNLYLKKATFRNCLIIFYIFEYRWCLHNIWDELLKRGWLQCRLTNIRHIAQYVNSTVILWTITDNCSLALNDRYPKT